MNDLYEELQVSPRAESEVIEAAFRRLARKYHPDVSADADSSDRMRRLAYAYGVLSDPGRRAAYDAVRRDFAVSAPTPATRGTWRLSRMRVVAIAAAGVLVLMFVFVPAARPLLARGLVVAAVLALALWLAYALAARRS